MSNLQTYYTYARLAQTAYIDLSSVGNEWRASADALVPATTVISLGALPTQERMPNALGNRLFLAEEENWHVISPYYNPVNGHSDESGFAAMLLSNPTEGKVLAIAGTEPTAGWGQVYKDLLEADLQHIGFWGVPSTNSSRCSTMCRR